jgi:hypothetical protein
MRNLLFRRKVLGVCFFSAACFLTAVGLFYTEENWRGKRAWQDCRRELEAKGANLDWGPRIPDAVPDGQNVFDAPAISEWFVKDSRRVSGSNELTRVAKSVLECARLRQVRALAEVTTMPAGTNPRAVAADLILNYRSSSTPPVVPQELEALNHLLAEAQGKSASADGGRSLTGAQGGLEFVSEPVRPTKTVRVAVLTDSLLRPAQLCALFQGIHAATASGSHRVRAEARGNDRFYMFLGQLTTISAADYLACSEEFTPLFDSIRRALERPYARRHGDYSHPWAVPIPNFVAIRTVAQVLAQRAQCYLLLDQPEKALREMTLLHEVHRLVEGKPLTLVAAMIHGAVTGLYSSIVAEGLRLHAWREPQLIVLQQQLHDVQLIPTLLVAIDTERAASCNAMEMTTASDFCRIYAFAEKSTSWSRLTDPECLLACWMPRGWVYQNVKEIALQAQSLLETTSSNNVVRPRQVDEAGVRSLSRLGRVSPYTVMARFAVPNSLKAFQTTARNQATVNQAYLACALERFYLAHMQYPASLETLVPAFANNVPIDPVSGSTLIYHCQSPNRFLLYSSGWDGIDGGGKPGLSTTDGDWVWDSNN